MASEQVFIRDESLPPGLRVAPLAVPAFLFHS